MTFNGVAIRSIVLLTEGLNILRNTHCASAVRQIIICRDMESGIYFYACLQCIRHVRGGSLFHSEGVVSMNKEKGAQKVGKPANSTTQLFPRDSDNTTINATQNLSLAHSLKLPRMIENNCQQAVGMFRAGVLERGWY